MGKLFNRGKTGDSSVNIRYSDQFLEKTMKQYDVEGLREREKYERFIEYILPLSDAFSVVYFQYRDSEKLSASARRIKDGLKKYKIYSKTTDSMPSMITEDHRHKYVYTLYKSDPAVKEILLSVENMYEWDYSKYPMDLCFFRNRRAFFVSSAHAHYADITIEDPGMKDALERLGIGLTFERNVTEDDLYYDEKAVSGNCPETPDDDFAVSESIPDEYDNCIGVTKEFYILADEESLYAVRMSDRQRITIANNRAGGFSDRVLFKDNVIYAALINGEFGEIFDNLQIEPSDGVWSIDPDRSLAGNLLCGQFDFIMDDDENIYVSSGEKTYKINCKTGKTEDFSVS